tara:strand:+ start:2455 stop:3531 length:1077 start_codon:yes stop_codon:yes gene_type:complete
MMQRHISFIVNSFIKSFIFVVMILTCLIFILNLVSELDFFRKIEVEGYFIIYLALINSPSFLFEILPFIFLISTQVFFIELFKNNEMNIFKYSGLRNSKVITIISITTVIISLFSLIIFYSFSSNLKNMYINLKKDFTNDGKYLAVITKNGLWIKDVFDNKNYIINAERIELNYLKKTYISEFDKEYNIIRNIKSPKIDIKNSNWIVHKPEVFINNNTSNYKQLEIKTNFDYEIIQNLYSNLSTLSILELFELRSNYKKLNYSLIEVNLEILKLFSYPLYFLLMILFSSIIMLNTRKFKSSILKISIGLISAVVIFYLNNIFYVLGKTEKINLIISVFAPLLILGIINIFLMNKINAK